MDREANYVAVGAFVLLMLVMEGEKGLARRLGMARA